MDAQTETTMAERDASLISHPDTALNAMLKRSQTEILGGFSPDQQQTIQHNLHVLSGLGYFIGKDFKMPIELNEPGQGWHWDFQSNRTRVDPQDLLERPMDELRFIISHEGCHRRISRVADVPLEVWKQPGFSFMTNAIEDPRVNNFGVDAYPRLKNQMDQVYRSNLDFETKAKEKAKDNLGFQPKFIQAGFEYIKQWFKEVNGQEVSLSEDLPDDVKEVVLATLEAARDSWWRYPSRTEANQGEPIIHEYANVSYEINRDHVWPEFKKLVEKDMENEKIQQMMQDMQGERKEGEEDQPGSGQGVPQDLSDRLSDGQKQELSGTLANGKDKPIDPDSLSDELKQKIKDYIDSLPDDIKKKLEDKAKQALKDLEGEINEDLEGHLSDDPKKKAEREVEKGEKTLDAKASDKTFDTDVRRREDDEEAQRQFRDLLEKSLKEDESVYERERKEVLPIIDELEKDLREIFVQRRAQRWETGHKSGKRIDITRRMQEKAKGIPAVESKAWQKRELPQKEDYAVSLLVDLSGSMKDGGKIDETFKAAIVLAEVLNRLSINTEILGFNDRLYVYQDFGQNMSQDIRRNMGGILEEVHDTSGTGKARWNDDGWALQQASERLARQKEREKFIFVLSDGTPVESSMHPRETYELSKIVNNIIKGTDQKLIGLGIGSGTEHVERYYPNSIANINVRQMAEKLADVIREVISNYGSF